jgi:predicted negative regulator of RcsB-dependent stress response
MATQHLDLDEQEQIANIKYFWQKWGTIITSVVTVVALSYLGWTGWQWYQNSQAQKSAVLFDELTKAVALADITKSDRVLTDMKDKFANTAYTAQAALLNARLNYEKGNLDAAKAALQWLSASGADNSYKDLAKLRLAGMLIEAKNYAEAEKILTSNISKPFAALAADRLADSYMLQNKTEEAKTQYLKAYAELDPHSDYKKMIEVKLAKLGAAPADLPK